MPNSRVDVCSMSRVRRQPGQVLGQWREGILWPCKSSSHFPRNRKRNKMNRSHMAAYNIRDAVGTLLVTFLAALSWTDPFSETP